MKRIALLAVAIALPVIAAAQDMDQTETGSIPPTVQTGTMTDDEVRAKLTAAGYTAIGNLELDSEGIWRTTAMKGDTMMSVSVAENGTIEDR